MGGKAAGSRSPQGWDGAPPPRFLNGNVSERGWNAHQNLHRPCTSAAHVPLPARGGTAPWDAAPARSTRRPHSPRAAGTGAARPRSHPRPPPARRPRPGRPQRPTRLHPGRGSGAVTGRLGLPFSGQGSNWAPRNSTRPPARAVTPVGTAVPYLGAHGRGLTCSFLPVTERQVGAVPGGSHGVVGRMTEHDVPVLLPEAGRRHTAEGASQGWLSGALRRGGEPGIPGAPGNDREACRGMAAEGGRGGAEATSLGVRAASGS